MFPPVAILKLLMLTAASLDKIKDFNKIVALFIQLKGKYEHIGDEGQR